MPAEDRLHVPRVQQGREGFWRRSRTPVPRRGTRPGGVIHRQGARWRDRRPHAVATGLAPRRVSVTTSSDTRRPSLMPTPAKPIPWPRALVVAAMSWYRASSRRRMPWPSSTMVSVDAAGSVARAISEAPESSEFATISVRIVSSIAPGYASRRSSRRCSRSTLVSPMSGRRPRACSGSWRSRRPGARPRRSMGRTRPRRRPTRSSPSPRASPRSRPRARSRCCR